MKIRILPSDTDGSDQQFLTSFLVNDIVALDAGCIGFHANPAEQAKVANVVLTHSHADHVCSLPTFAMNLMDYCGRRTVVWAHEAVLESLREDLFNGRVWPDFLTLVPEGEPIVRLEAIQPRQPFTLNGLTFTAIPVNHPVPTMGYVVEDGQAAIVICTDSGPTDELWERARALPHLWDEVYERLGAKFAARDMRELTGASPNLVASIVFRWKRQGGIAPTPRRGVYRKVREA